MPFWKSLGKIGQALMPMDFMISGYVFVKTYPAIITERQKWLLGVHSVTIIEMLTSLMNLRGAQLRLWCATNSLNHDCCGKTKGVDSGSLKFSEQDVSIHEGY